MISPGAAPQRVTRQRVTLDHLQRRRGILRGHIQKAQVQRGAVLDTTRMAAGEFQQNKNGAFNQQKCGGCFRWK